MKPYRIAGLLSLILLMGLPVRGDAASLLSISVDRIDGVYVFHSEVWFDASVEQMYGVFIDWDQSTKFSSIVVESRDLEPDESGRPRYYSRNRACLLFFCQSFERYGYVEAEALTYIVATADPELSDFHISDERWDFREEDGGTVVDYRLKMKPKFFLPPIIGPAIMKRKLRSGGTDAIDRIEAIAQEWVADAE